MSKFKRHKYDPKYAKMLIDYFNEGKINGQAYEYLYDEEGNAVFSRQGHATKPAQLRTLSGFASTIEVPSRVLSSWAADNEDFDEAMEMAKDIQKDILIQNGMTGGYNPAVVQFYAKCVHGMRESPEDDSTNPPLNITFEVKDCRTRPNADFAEHSST